MADSRRSFREFWLLGVVVVSGAGVAESGTSSTSVEIALDAVSSAAGDGAAATTGADESAEGAAGIS